MKDNQTKLELLLKEWSVTSPLPPRFAEHVWKRIERAEAPRVALADALSAWFAMVFARPAYAVAYVSALFVIGVVLGFVQANQKTAHWDRQLETRYVQSIDPYQKGH